MAIGVNKNTTKIAVVAEVTEGVAVAPSAGTDFIQIQSDGFEMSPAKELVDRAILTPNKGKATPRVSTTSASGSIPVEWKASGTEGIAPETDIIIKSCLGQRVDIGARITTGTGHTTTTINKVAHGLVVGQSFIILEAGSHHAAFVKTVTDVDNIVFFPAASFTPSDAVELSKSATYSPAADEPTFTLNTYHGDEILEQHDGCRASALSVENLTTGQIPTLSFSYEALGFTESDTSAAFTPVFDDATPPLALSVKVFKDGECLDMDEASLSIENTVAFITSIKSADGRISSRISERSVTGALTPYLDDTDLGLFNNFNDNDVFELAITLGVPGAVAGEFELGTCVSIYCPNCIITSLGKADKDGIMTRPLEFTASAGATGDNSEIFLGYC